MKAIAETSARAPFTSRGSLILLFTLTALLLPCLQAGTIEAKKARRITFKSGATTARVNGSLKGINDEALFVLRARKGQHMRVNINGEGPTRGMVTFPSGGQDGAPGGVIYDDVLPETGDYRIRVIESQMGEAWRGSFVLEVEIR